MTARRSIKCLVDQGIVITIQGSRTYAKAPPGGGITFSLEEFHNIFKDKEQTKARILEVLIIKDDETTAKRLAIRVGERAIRIRRVLIQGGD